MPQKYRNIVFYLLLFVGGGAFMLWIGHQGAALETADAVKPSASGSNWATFIEDLGENFVSPFTILLAQIITIIVVARLCGFLFKKIGQPAVIGEILAGIILGPSLLGNYFSEYFNLLFPEQSLENLHTVSNIGLIFFMFVVGMEVDMRVLKSKISESIAVSQAGIIFPFALGMGLSYFLYSGDLVPSEVPFISFALFMGVSMSITAFPVLARIAQERGISKTKLGTVILACAAINDIMAWCILAVIIAIAKAGTVVSSLYTILFAVVYVIIMIKVAKPFLQKIADLHYSKENLNKGVVAVFFLVLLLSAFCTDMIGIHALFGAFMAGAIMPNNTKFRDIFVDKVEDVANVIFLPLFFVYTGLRTKIGLLNDIHLWEITGIIVLVAIVGKLLGSAIAAKFVGRQTWRNSLIVGTLMNTRGLMELVAINIGYDLGVISSEIFVMLVVMALVTTFMTSPMLSLIRKIFPNNEIKQELERKQAQGIFKALLSVGNPEGGKYLLRVAKNMLEGESNKLEVVALHVTAGSDTNPLHREKFMQESFVSIEQEAQLLDVPMQKEYEISDNIENTITSYVNDFGFDFLLIGGGLSFSEEPFLKDSSLFGKRKWLNKIINKLVRQRVRFYPQTLIKDKTKFFIENANCSVGVFINRNFHQITSMAVVLNAETDGFLLRYARRILRNSINKVNVVIYDTNNVLGTSDDAQHDFQQIKNQYPSCTRLSGNRTFLAINSRRYNFMLISYQAWNTFISQDKTIKEIPSTLIINKKESRFEKK